MIIISEPKLWRAHGDSIADVQQWMISNPIKWTTQANTLHRQDGFYSGEWSLGHSYEKVQELARDGWSEGAVMLDDILANRLPARGRMGKWRYDMAGDLPDIPRHLAGAPDCMKRRGNDNAHRPVISLFINNWINSAVKGKAMANYGAAMIAAIDQLENTGKRVELIVGTVAPQYRDSKLVMSVTWTAKKPEDPIDFAALAFSLAHPGASRRFGWAVWARSNAQSDTAYGVANGFDAKNEHFIDPLPGMVKMRGLVGQQDRCHTMEDAIKFVREQINAAAGEELVTMEN